MELIDGLQAKFDRYVSNGNVDQIIEDILVDTGYQAMLKASGEEGMDRLDNIKELQNDLAEAIKNTPDFTIEEYLQNISLLSDSTKENQASGVTLMTVHAAKGTEAPVVFIVGVNEGVFPSLRSIQTGGAAALEEERRLMYVAMTRAQEKLYISWNRGYSFQIADRLSASRFIVEIPDQCVKQDEPTPRQSPAFFRGPTPHCQSTK
ncbi:ATP-dependent DNA helicase PcrA [gut metagenome]|uniref:ATP-dependent DNA helicase PcrA n=1 Tax=gut metagenome TaxID=749906 RepID=J9GLU6_9ZZZZ